jgi:hypothetical protein
MPRLTLKGTNMCAGIVYDTLLEHHGNHILLSGGAQVFLDGAVPCDFPVDTYLKVAYTEINGRKVARGISPSDSFRALDVTP